ncbi:MAG TPA: DUF4254 domain-containing protein [Planctomycetaceae bacterium]|nr:DUF4254 domain-containing protein [Planctomycetaceae bacterium]
MPIDVEAIVRLHREMVVRWHQKGEVDVPYDGGFEAIVCRQFTYNYLLWHEEDIARSPDVGDARIAAVKRAIDGYNQKRNDWMERMDDWITDELQRQGVSASPNARQNTETPGSVIDRMSILALRIYHLEEEAARPDATAEHLEKVQGKLAICLEQLDDLSRALGELLEDIFAGRKRHKTYRHLKMYNDPELNPYLYRARKRKAG